MKWWGVAVALLLGLLLYVLVILPMRVAWAYFTEADECERSS